jgi:hypothetical protein
VSCCFGCSLTQKGPQLPPDTYASPPVRRPQEFVLYDGEVCLGAAPVLAAGPSLWEQGRPLPVGLTADDSLHMAALAGHEQVQSQAVVC